jgi:hypothetical protein
MPTRDVTNSTSTTTDDNHSSASKRHDADHAKNAFAVSGTSPTHNTSQSASSPPTPDTTPTKLHKMNCLERFTAYLQTNCLAVDDKLNILKVEPQFENNGSLCESPATCTNGHFYEVVGSIAHPRKGASCRAFLEKAFGCSITTAEARATYKEIKRRATKTAADRLEDAVFGGAK